MSTSDNECLNQRRINRNIGKRIDLREIKKLKLANMGKREIRIATIITNNY